MKTGLCTYDSTAGRSFQKKVALAVVLYRRKYGFLPNTVCVHPEAFFKYAGEAEETKIGGITVKPLRTVLRHHFWTGMEEKTKKEKAKACVKS